MTARRAAFTLLVAASVAVPAGARATACSVVSGSLSFATYDPFSPDDLDVSGTFQFDCHGNKDVPVTIYLGAGSSGSVAARAMQRVGGGTPLRYNLYTTTGRTAVWSDVGGPGQPLFLVGPQPLVVTVYGRVPKQQNVEEGSYSDTIVVTAAY